MNFGPARWLLVPAAACAALAGFFLAQHLERSAPQLASGTWLPQARALPDFQLLDTAGRTVTRGDLSGAPTLVFFGFTNCPDVCPTTLLKLAQLRRHAPVRGLRVVFVSIDPQRDTPPVLASYLHAFDPQIAGLTGDSHAIARLAGYFGVAVNRVELPGGSYTMDHSAVVFLVDAAARIVAVFTPPFEVAALAADLKRAAPYLAAHGRTAT